MPGIKNIKFSLTKSGTSWTLNGSYVATFTKFEVDSGMEFRDMVRLYEEDSGLNGADDRLVSKTLAVFNPNAKEVKRTFTVSNISENTIDTEGGEEELYVRVYIRNKSLSLPWVTRRGSRMDLDI